MPVCVYRCMMMCACTGASLCVFMKEADKMTLGTSGELEMQIDSWVFRW